MKGIYGGRLELYYSVASNKKAVGGSLSQSIDQALKVNVLDKLGGDGSISFNLHSAIDIAEGSYSESTRIKARGGNTFTAFSLGGSFASDYKSWANSVDTSPALIGATTDGLIPLWMFLPEQYDTPENIEKMKETFKSYATAYKNGLLVGHDAKDSYSTGYISVRTAEKKVTDSGRFKQHHDDLDLNDQFPYAIDVMHEYGYDKMKVEIKLKARRVDKGYFYVFLYKSLNDNKDSQSIAETNFTLEKKGVIYDKSFSFDNLSTGLFAGEDFLVIRYGAKGDFQDDWYNSDVSVNITYTKQ